MQTRQSRMRHLFDTGSSEYQSTSKENRESLVVTLYLTGQLEREIFEHRVYMNGKGYSSRVAIENLFHFLDTFSTAFHKTWISTYFKLYQEETKSLSNIHLYHRFKNEPSNQLTFTEQEIVAAEYLVLKLIKFIYDNGIYEDSNYHLYKTKIFGKSRWLCQDLILQKGTTVNSYPDIFWSYEGSLALQKRLKSNWKLPTTQDFERLFSHLKEEFLNEKTAALGLNNFKVNWEDLSLDNQMQLFDYLNSLGLNMNLHGVKKKDEIKNANSKINYWVSNKRTTIDRLTKHAPFFFIEPTLLTRMWGGTSDFKNYGRCIRLVTKL